MGFKLKSGNKPSFKNLGSGMPVKTTGLGPRTSFGGSKNPELVSNKPKPQKKVMVDGPKNSVHGIDLGKDPHWQPHQFKASPNKICAPGGPGDGCGGDFKVKKKGNVVSRTTKKVGKGVKNIVKGIGKGIKKTIKKHKENRRKIYDKKNKGTTTYMNPRYMKSHTMTASEEKAHFDN